MSQVSKLIQIQRIQELSANNVKDIKKKYQAVIVNILKMTAL